MMQSGFNALWIFVISSVLDDKSSRLTIDSYRPSHNIPTSDPVKEHVPFLIDGRFPTCRAHECFQCRSDEDRHCADSKSLDFYRKPCNFESSYGYCRKSIFTLYFTGQSQPVIIRECANRQLDTLTTVEEGCYFGRYTRDSYSLTCECRGDCCNGTHLSTQRSIFPLYDYILFYLIIQLVVR